MDSIIGRVIASILTLILIAGVGFAAYNAFQGNKVSTMTTGMATLVQSIQQDYASYPTFSGLSKMPISALSSVKNLWSTTSASTAESDLVGTSGSLIDPWGDDLEVTSGATQALGSPAATSSNIVITDAGTNLGASSCKKLAIEVGASAYETIVDGKVVNTGGTAGTPIDPVATATDCGSGDVAISWVFGH